MFDCCHKFIIISYWKLVYNLRLIIRQYIKCSINRPSVIESPAHVNVLHCMESYCCRPDQAVH